MKCLCGECPPCKRRAKDRHRYHTNPARKEQTAARIRKFKARKRFFVLCYLLGHPCVECGEADPLVLEFDHVRGVKKHNVGNIIANLGTLKLLMEEIAKCDVRCANCHRRKTKLNNEWRNGLTGYLTHDE